MTLGQEYGVYCTTDKTKAAFAHREAANKI